MAKPAGIQYAGLAGISKACEDALLRFLQYGDNIEKVRILSAENFHALLLTIDESELVAVKSGFSSGYAGEGPGTFSRVLRLLRDWAIDIDEVEVDAGLLRRLDDSALTERDLARIDSLQPRRGMRWTDYILEHDSRDFEARWGGFRPIIPFAIVDRRLRDLAKRFASNEDQCLLEGYRRLEDTVRTRTSSRLHGQNLFSKAFIGDGALLEWPGIERGEQTGRGQLFVGAFTAFRNRRAHHPPDWRGGHGSWSDPLQEFLLLNHLFCLEAQAQVREAAPAQSNDSAPASS